MPEDIQNLYDSCMEGYDGSWDCSSEEGRKGFLDMIEILKRIAVHCNVSLVEV